MNNCCLLCHATYKLLNIQTLLYVRYLNICFKYLFKSFHQWNCMRIIFTFTSTIWADDNCTSPPNNRPACFFFLSIRNSSSRSQTPVTGNRARRKNSLCPAHARRYWWSSMSTIEKIIQKRNVAITWRFQPISSARLPKDVRLSWGQLLKVWGPTTETKRTTLRNVTADFDWSLGTVR